jgi:hypothetical protein
MNHAENANLAFKALIEKSIFHTFVSVESLKFVKRSSQQKIDKQKRVLISAIAAAAAFTRRPLIKQFQFH